jgi:hypothetical protein
MFIGIELKERDILLARRKCRELWALSELSKFHLWMFASGSREQLA